MHAPSIRTRAQIVATLATLQTGIEPATLTLLVANHAVNPADFGWIVSAGQFGMTCGAVLGWRQTTSRRAPTLIAPAVAIGVSLLLPVEHGLAAVLVLRVVLGIVMGFLLTRAMASAARDRPHNAIGIIFLAQQILSTAVLAGLPVLAAFWGPGAALAMLAAAPLVIALLSHGEDAPVRPESVGEAAMPDTPTANALVPMVLIVAVTMMLWSYIAPVGAALGLRERDVGFAIALGSLASAPAAMLAAASRPRYPPWLTALACGGGMLSPLVVPVAAGLTGYLAALALFNAGSTFGTIRFSAWAMRANGRQRQFVVLMQCVAMSAGPALGAVAVHAGGLPAFGILAAVGLTAAMLLPLVRKIHGAGTLRLDAVTA